MGGEVSRRNGMSGINPPYPDIENCFILVSG